MKETTHIIDNQTIGDGIAEVPKFFTQREVSTHEIYTHEEMKNTK